MRHLWAWHGGWGVFKHDFGFDVVLQARPGRKVMGTPWYVILGALAVANILTASIIILILWYMSRRQSDEAGR